VGVRILSQEHRCLWSWMDSSFLLERGSPCIAAFSKNALGLDSEAVSLAHASRYEKGALLRNFQRRVRPLGSEHLPW
jgi:hypothetical protein